MEKFATVLKALDEQTLLLIRPQFFTYQMKLYFRSSESYLSPPVSSPLILKEVSPVLVIQFITTPIERGSVSPTPSLAI